MKTKKIGREPKDSNWSLLDTDSQAVVEDPAEALKDAKVKHKGVKKEKQPKPRTHWLGDELDKSELMVRKPIRKADIIGGRKMVFYQYKPELYSPPGTNFAGRRKSDKTSSYRGVYWNKNHRKWEVKLKLLGRTFSLGFRETEEGAARVYDSFITKFIINRLAINFPEDIGGVRLSVADLVSEDNSSVEEANEKLKKRLEKKVQDMAIDFGLETEESLSEGCKDWPFKPGEVEEES